MATTNPGQIRAEQLQKTTWAADASHLASAAPAYSALVDPALAMKGSEFWHPGSIPMDTTAGGFVLNANRKFRAKVDAVSIVINGSGELEIPALIGGGELPINNLPLHASGGLEVSGGDLRLKVLAPLSLSGSGLDVDKATDSTDGTVSVDITKGLTVGSPSPGVIALNIDTATLAFSAGAVKVKDATFLNLTSVSSQTVTGPVTFGQTIALSAQRITGVADPSAAQDAATKAYVDGAVASGAPVPQPTVKGFAAAATNLNVGGITNGDYVIATDAAMYSANAIGDLLRIVDKTLAGASRFDQKITATGVMTTYSDDTVDSGTHAAGQFLYNSGATAGADGTKWFLTVAAAAVSVATEATAVSPAAGKVLIGNGLFRANGTTGDMRIRLGTDLAVPVSTALSLINPGDGTNYYLQVKTDAAFFSITASGLSLLDGGITNAKVASGGLNSDRLSYQANPGLVSGPGLGMKVKVKASAGITLDGDGLSISGNGIDETMLKHDDSLWDADGGGTIGVHYDAAMFEIDPTDGLRIRESGITPALIALGSGLEDVGGALTVAATATFTFSGNDLELAASGVKASMLDKGNGLGTSGTSVIVVPHTAQGIQVTASGVGIANAGVKHALLNLAAASALRDAGSGAIAVAVDDSTIEISSNQLRIKTTKFGVITRYDGTAIPNVDGSGNYVLTSVGTASDILSGRTRVYLNGIELEAGFSVNLAARTVTVFGPTSASTPKLAFALDNSATGDCVTVITDHA